MAGEAGAGGGVCRVVNEGGEDGSEKVQATKDKLRGCQRKMKGEMGDENERNGRRRGVGETV